MPNLGTKPPMVEEAVEEEGELLTFIHWGEKAHFYTPLLLILYYWGEKSWTKQKEEEVAVIWLTFSYSPILCP